MKSKTQALLGAGTLILSGLTAATIPAAASAAPGALAQAMTASQARMIAKAWLDDSYRASLLAQGIKVPARPNDIADEELDTSAHAVSGLALYAQPCGNPTPCRKDMASNPASYAALCRAQPCGQCDRG